MGGLVGSIAYGGGTDWSWSFPHAHSLSVYKFSMRASERLIFTPLRCRDMHETDADLPWLPTCYHQEEKEQEGLATAILKQNACHDSSKTTIS